MSLINKREPQGRLNQLIARVKISTQCLRLPLRTVLAFETLAVDYRHRGKQIQMGEFTPVPWYTYPMIEHLLLCDLSGLNIWEWGGGNSTLFWAKRAQSCISVERAPQWHEFVAAGISAFPKSSCFLAVTKQEYVNKIDSFGKFDMVIIDGNWRYDCAFKALEHLTPDSVIIVDNSDWCPDTCALLQEHGYARLDFNGFGPANQFTWSTSLFFKNTKSPALNPQKQPDSLGGVARDCSGYMFAGEHED